MRYIVRIYFSDPEREKVNGFDRIEDALSWMEGEASKVNFVASFLVVVEWPEPVPEPPATAPLWVHRAMLGGRR